MVSLYDSRLVSEPSTPSTTPSALTGDHYMAFSVAPDWFLIGSQTIHPHTSTICSNWSITWLSLWLQIGFCMIGSQTIHPHTSTICWRWMSYHCQEWSSLQILYNHLSRPCCTDRNLIRQKLKSRDKNHRGKGQGWEFAHLLIRSFAHFTQIKWVTVSESLRLLMTNERPWGFRSGRSW